jgi:hypothetical protein
MPGAAAVTIWCDVAFDVRAEFDDWHAHEHVPERLSIPGFLRASRWIAADGGTGNLMLYETQSEETTASGPYLERLNHPTPWSRKMMPHHRNMVRSLCRVQYRCGAGLGQALLSVRFSPEGDREEGLAAWLASKLASLPARRGLVSAQHLRNIARPDLAPTTEQKLRGGDAAADWIVLVTGYDADALASLAAGELGAAALVAAGAAPGSKAGLYRLAYLQ